MEDLKHNSGLRDRLIQILGLDGASEYWDSSHSIEVCIILNYWITQYQSHCFPSEAL